MILLTLFKNLFESISPVYPSFIYVTSHILSFRFASFLIFHYCRVSTF